MCQGQALPKPHTFQKTNMKWKENYINPNQDIKMDIEKIKFRRKVIMEFTQMISRDSVADWKHQIYCGM